MGKWIGHLDQSPNIMSIRIFFITRNIMIAYTIIEKKGNEGIFIISLDNIYMLELG
jgi:hypothetical protein